MSRLATHVHLYLPMERTALSQPSEHDNTTHYEFVGPHQLQHASSTFAETDAFTPVRGICNPLIRMVESLAYVLRGYIKTALSAAFVRRGQAGIPITDIGVPLNRMCGVRQSYFSADLASGPIEVDSCRGLTVHMTVLFKEPFWLLEMTVSQTQAIWWSFFGFQRSVSSRYSHHADDPANGLRVLYGGGEHALSVVEVLRARR
jgi:hypothetical protein